MAQRIVILILFAVAITNTPAQAAPTAPDAAAPQLWPFSCWPETWYTVSATIVSTDRVDAMVTNVGDVTTPQTRLAVWGTNAAGEMVYENVFAIPALAPGESFRFSAAVSVYLPSGQIIVRYQWQDWGTACETHDAPYVYRRMWIPCAFVGSGANCDGVMP